MLEIYRLHLRLKCSQLLLLRYFVRSKTPTTLPFTPLRDFCPQGLLMRSSKYLKLRCTVYRAASSSRHIIRDKAHPRCGMRHGQGWRLQKLDGLCKTLTHVEIAGNDRASRRWDCADL